MNFSRLIDFKGVRQLNKVNLANFFQWYNDFSHADWSRAMVDECYARCDAHDLLVHKRTVDVTGNLGVFFVLSNMARFWKCLRDYFVLRK